MKNLLKKVMKSLSTPMFNTSTQEIVAGIIIWLAFTLGSIFVAEALEARHNKREKRKDVEEKLTGWDEL